jgi:hypothetical protein
MKSAGERPYPLRLNGTFGETDEMTATALPKVVMPYSDDLIVLAATKDRA